MSAYETSALSKDLENIACRVEGGAVLRTEFCDRLTRSLAQLFGLAALACTEEDRASFDRILIRVAPSASVDAREFLSDRLADVDAPPHGILLMLAKDQVEIARPILVRSPALGEDELVDIARTLGSGHMGAIAERADLTLRITDVLVLRGDDEVRRVVAGNTRAPISDKSFARLSLQSRGDTLIEARLVRRGDLPDVVIHFLLENGSPSTRETLAERSSHRVRNELGRCNLPIRAAEDGWLDSYDFVAAASILSRLAEARDHVDIFIRRLAQGDHFAEIVHILSAITGLGLDTTKHVLVSLDTEPFVVMARVLGLRNETVLELLATGPWLHRLDVRNRDATMARFRSLDPEEARERMKVWVDHDKHQIH